LLFPQIDSDDDVQISGDINEIIGVSKDGSDDRNQSKDRKNSIMSGGGKSMKRKHEEEDVIPEKKIQQEISITPIPKTAPSVSVA
jgi:hypothetical protein